MALPSAEIAMNQCRSPGTTRPGIKCRSERAAMKIQTYVLIKKMSSLDLLNSTFDNLALNSAKNLQKIPI